jgi:hypothetical protein
LSKLVPQRSQDSLVFSFVSFCCSWLHVRLIPRLSPRGLPAEFKFYSSMRKKK